jgi:hypothetical protein
MRLGARHDSKSLLSPITIVAVNRLSQFSIPSHVTYLINSQVRFIRARTSSPIGIQAIPTRATFKGFTEPAVW